MRQPAGILPASLAVCFAACLAACASPGTAEPPAANPIDMQSGWRIYVYGQDGSVAGVTTLPQHPADSTRPEEMLGSIAGAFCVPVLDKNNKAADDRLRDFCREPGHPEGRGRVVLAPGWGDATPPYSDCFIHCVCEGYSPRTEEQAERTREAETGPCTNRLNCRLDCPAAGSP